MRAPEGVPGTVPLALVMDRENHPSDSTSSFFYQRQTTIKMFLHHVLHAGAGHLRLYLSVVRFPER